MTEEEYLDYIKKYANKDFLDVMCNVLGYTKEDIINPDKEMTKLLNSHGVTKTDIDEWLGIKTEKSEEEVWDCSCLPEDFTEEDFNYALGRGLDEDEKDELGFV